MASVSSPVYSMAWLFGAYQRSAYRKLLRKLKPGDTFVVKSIDRFGGRDCGEILEQQYQLPILKKKEVIKMLKKISALLVSVALIFSISINVFAASWEEVFNNMTMTPETTDQWSDVYYDLINDNVGLSNYERLRSTYDDWATTSMDGVNCVGYAVALQTAWEVIGVRTYHIRGETKTSAGGWTEHSWVGVIINDQMYYFDANLPGQHGATGNYFGILPENATWYRNAEIMQLYVSPERPMYFIAGTCSIDADDRENYGIIPVSKDYAPNGVAEGLVGVDGSFYQN